MTGRPDYDAGDLVICVDDSPCPFYGPFFLAKYSCWQVLAVFPPDPFDGRWGVALYGADPSPAIGFVADRFRKVDPKPPAFWTGDIEVDQPERVTA